MSLLAWLIFGLAVGIVANSIDPKPSYGGVIGAVVFGTAGALVGGFIVSAYMGSGIVSFNILSVVVAIIGALGLLMIIKSFRRA